MYFCVQIIALIIHFIKPGKMKKYYLMFLLFLSAASLTAQISIKGTVYSKDSKETLPGVTVVVKGTSQGTITDLDGKFYLTADPAATLEFSYVGYKTLDIPVNGQTSFEVMMEIDTKELDEVVVVGYGVQKKSDVTGALVSISGDEMQETHQQGIESILQGRAAGVTVTSNSGAPGKPEEINIRGISSINGSPPLWIVDGVPTTGGVNPQDIESIEILKDASATAIYGTDGANGVILVTTKKGKKGRMRINYENRFAWGHLYKQLELTTAKQWAKLRSEAYQNAGLPVPPALGEPYGTGTNWQEAVTRTAASMNHYLSFSGGSDKLSWFMSANYNDEQGIVKKSDYSALDLRINTKAKLYKWLTVGENISFSGDNWHPINEDDEWNAIMVEAISIDPITPVQKEDGSWGGSVYNTVNNPVAHLDRTKTELKDYSIGGNFFADVTFLKDFVFTSRLGYYQSFGNNYDWMPTFFVKTGEENSQTSVSRDYYESREWVFTNYLTWSRKFGKHDLKVMAGMESEENYKEWFGVTATDLISEKLNLIYIDNATGNQDASAYGLASNVKYASYFGRINYNLSDKYFLTVNFRRQGSSMFGPDNRWGSFPSASAGWRIDRENFMKNIDLVTNLKLRLGYGISGNDHALQPYSYYATSETGQRYVFGNKIVDGVAFPRIPNGELHWEQKSSLNLGVDLAMWDDRFTFTGDFFINKTDQMLYDPDLPGHVGTQLMPFTNVAAMKNTGIELVVGYRNTTKSKFKYDFKLNFSHIKNEVVDLGSASYIPAVPFMQLGYISRTEVGHPMASFYGYLTDGLFQTQQEVDDYVKPDGTPIQPNAAPGDIRYKADENGNLITDFIGSPLPDFTAGLNMKFNYKGFSLLMFFYGVYGNEIFNATRFFNLNSSVRYNVEASLMNRWMMEGDTDDPNMARLNINDANNSLRSDRFIEDGSYLRLKNLQLEYALPSKIFNNIDISSLKVFAGCTNAFTLTRYSGFDPEIGLGYDNNPLDRGIDRARYPSPRTFYVGLNLLF
jgi:TonB-linked SusC/RagA family outer membrane protein